MDPNYLKICEEWVQENIVSEDQDIKKSRKRPQRIDFWETEWGRLVLDPSTLDPKSAQGLKFRRRFRLPFPLFKEVLVPICRDKNIFDIKVENMVSNDCFSVFILTT